MEEKLAYIDKDGTLLAFAGKVQSTSIILNTEMVKPQEIKGYRDLLNPKWKGKIAMYDPIVAGIGLRWFGVVSTKILDVEYMRQLAAHEPVVVRDARQHVEWIARGKYPVGTAAEPPIVYEFQKLGAPLRGVLPVEGSWVASGWGNVALINRPSHPSAARVFLNWLLTKEGQTAYSLSSGDPSRRLDVPTGHIDPQYIPEPGKSYILSESEDILLAQPEQAKKAKEIFGALLK
jgi:iron(III) transport system substrate-binding protein